MSKQAGKNGLKEQLPGAVAGFLGADSRAGRGMQAAGLERRKPEAGI